MLRGNRHTTWMYREERATSHERGKDPAFIVVSYNKDRSVTWHYRSFTTQGDPND